MTTKARDERVLQGAASGFGTHLQPGKKPALVMVDFVRAFFGTSLSSTLSANDIDTVIIAGVSTSGCIRATVVDTIQHGFIPIVPREAVGDRDDAPHEANLFDIQQKYGEVMSEDDVIAYLKQLATKERKSS